MNILLAADGSDYEREAGRLLDTWLRPDTRVGVDIVTVQPTEGGAVPVDDNSEWVDNSRLRQDHWSPEVPSRRRIVSGDPVATLLRAAEDYDLVVAGTKGRGASPFFELGSVATSLVNHAPTSVLLVRKGRPRTSRAPSETERNAFKVVLATDGAGISMSGVERVLEPFLRPETTIHVVTVRTPDARESIHFTDPESWWTDHVATDAAAFGSAPKPSFRILNGPPALQLERYVSAFGADLLVLGARGQVARKDPPGLGNTAAKLAWAAPCSVLVVRPPRVEDRSERLRPSVRPLRRRDTRSDQVPRPPRLR